MMKEWMNTSTLIRVTISEEGIVTSMAMILNSSDISFL